MAWTEEMVRGMERHALFKRGVAAEPVGLGFWCHVEDREDRSSGWQTPGVCGGDVKLWTGKPRGGTWDAGFCFVHIESESPVTHWVATSRADDYGGSVALETVLFKDINKRMSYGHIGIVIEAVGVIEHRIGNVFRNSGSQTLLCIRITWRACWKCGLLSHAS